MKLHSVSSGVTELPVHSFKEMHKQRGGRPTEPHQVPVLLLDENGLIKDCSQSVESLFGYRLNELAWQHVSCLLPNSQRSRCLRKGGSTRNLIISPGAATFSRGWISKATPSRLN